MKKIKTNTLIISLLLLTSWACKNNTNNKVNGSFPHTIVSIKENMFFINGEPTFKGRSWKGFKIEGLLPNSRMVQGVFDDLNPKTVENWVYTDTKTWDPERNTNEFVAAMNQWYAHGLRSVTVNLQGGSPMGYGNKEWYNSAFTPSGELKDDYMKRMDKILQKGDQIGMVVILGIFYFGQDQYLEDEEAVVKALDNTMEWLFDKGYRNVLIEVNNECNNVKYDHDILKQDHVQELILRIRNMEKNGYRYPVSTSFNGNTLPPSHILEVCDFVLLHGNGVNNPARITEMVQQTRNSEGYHTMPVVFNEDDHYDFLKPENNMLAAIQSYASWGYFDYRRKGESFEEGYQCPPVDWGINSKRKKAFFNFLKEITGV
jgi:hypothetical protein